MSVENVSVKPPFDPFVEMWKIYRDKGMEALMAVEAPLLVFVPEDDLVKDIIKKYPDYKLQPEDLNWMILPDALPVVPTRFEGNKLKAPGHLIVAGSRQVSYWDASPPERHVLNELTVATAKHMEEIAHPEHGVMQGVFGRIPTIHVHLVAREEREDGLDWHSARPEKPIPVEDRHKIRKRFAFERIEDCAERIQEIGNTALIRFL